MLKRAVWLFDPCTCRGLYANPPALALWGAQTETELLARDFSKLSPAVRARTDRLALATADGAVIAERWTFYPNGEPLTVQAAISSFEMPDGRAVLLFEAAPADVGEEERRAVEALRHTSSVITLLGEDDERLFENPAAFAAYGWAETAVRNRFANAASGEELIGHARAGLASAALCEMRTTDGTRWHLVDARPTTDPVTGATGVLLNEQDVTAQIAAERALAAADQRAALAESKQRFLANMSHELRTPLTSILGFADLMAAGDVDPGHVGRIRASGRKLLGLVNDMILLSELDEGRVASAVEPFDALAVAEAALARAGEAAQGKGLAVLLEVKDPINVVLGDAPRLAIVLDHFLDNAVKFTPSGSVRLTLAHRDSRLEMAVEDEGPGLDDAKVADLFDRFRQGDMGTTKIAGGGGLGLSVCRELARLMGGEVGGETRAEGGSRFWLSLPAPAQGTAAPEAPLEVRALKVLYADDHENNRLLIKTMLATQGHSCDLAEDGAQAVEAASAGDYDLILMDIQMPVMDGVEATRRIRALEGPAASTPILALTANTLDAERDAYAEAGMDDCLAKPVALVDLIARITAWSAYDWRAELNAEIQAA